MSVHLKSSQLSQAVSSSSERTPVLPSRCSTPPVTTEKPRPGQLPQRRLHRTRHPHQRVPVRRRDPQIHPRVLQWADVTRRDGAPAGIHYWNRLDSGLEIDLTRDQFRNGEQLGGPSTQQPLRVATARMAARYDLYAARARDRLGCHIPRGIPTAGTQNTTSA
jgi:hypothetical protein